MGFFRAILNNSQRRARLLYASCIDIFASEIQFEPHISGLKLLMVKDARKTQHADKNKLIVITRYEICKTPHIVFGRLF